MMTATITTLTSAKRALELYQQGKAHVVKTHHSNGQRPEISVIAKSHGYSAKVAAKHVHLFEKFLAEHGNGDGLLPECPQTSTHQNTEA
jgi:hypothetical protein